MPSTARLLFPAIRWNPDSGSYDDHRPTVERGLDLGVGGFIIFGGPAAAVRELTAELQGRSAHPLLIGADLERGAGQQFEGATSLPPPAAILELDDTALTHRAGELTAREALAMGVNWLYAPVADLDLEPENPIVGSRAFGSDPERASRHVGAWIEGCHAGGALACAKHFPGHGRTTTDSHLELPIVDASVDELETDLAPFRAAIEAEVDSMMTAHVAYAALDPSGLPATLSRPILTTLLRERMGYRGLVVTDALIMKGFLGGAEAARDVGGEAGGEAGAAVRALAAGCDALLYPDDLAAVATALERARGGVLDEARVVEALERIEVAAIRVADVTARRTAERDELRTWGREGDAAWAMTLARRSLRVVRGAPDCPGVVEVVTVDDDTGGPFPDGSRETFPAQLRESGITVHEVARPSGAMPVLVALYADIKGFKGRPGLSEAAVETVSALIANPKGAVVILFGHPRLAGESPGRDILVAWAGDPLMQKAAADWLADNRRVIERPVV